MSSTDRLVEVRVSNEIVRFARTPRMLRSHHFMIAIVTALATLSLTSTPIGAVGNSSRVQNGATNREFAHLKHPAHAGPSCATFFDNIGALVAPGIASVLGPGIGVKLSSSKFMPSGYGSGEVKQWCYYEASGNPTLWYDNGTTVPPPDPADVYVWWGGITAHDWNLLTQDAIGIWGCQGGGCVTTVSPLPSGTFGLGTQGVLVTTATNGVFALPSTSPYANYYGELVRKDNCVLEMSLWPVASPSTLTALINQFLVRHPSF
jgi:hypothetical protein